MFTCEYCSRFFARKDILKRHGDCRKTVNICSVCQESHKSERALQQHMKKNHPTSERPAADQISSLAVKRARVELCGEPSTSNIQHCTVCTIDVPTTHWQGHLRTLAHRENCCMEHEEGVYLVRTAFKHRIATYRISSTEDPTEVRMFMESLKKKILKLLESNIRRFENIKVGLELFGCFLLQVKELTEVKSFNTKFRIVDRSTDVEELFTQLSAILARKMSEFQDKDSGWTLQRLLHAELCVNKYNPLRASSYIRLPKTIEMKRAVLNIQNQDEKCFMWSVLAALHPIHSSQSANRTTNYKPFEGELDFTGMEFPIKLKDISRFEQLNAISINVYGLENFFNDGKNEVQVVGPLHFTKSRKETHVNLLLISDDYDNKHYCLIKNMSRLISSQLSSHKNPKYLCDGCLIYFPSIDNLKAHQTNDCNHVTVNLPSTNLRKNKYGEDVPENLLKFENFEKKLKVPFVVYADFETIVASVDNIEENKLNSDGSYTIKTHKHIPYSFAYYIKSSFNDSLSVFKTYRGEDVIEKFIELLESDCKRLFNYFLRVNIPMLPLTFEQQKEFDTATICHICEKSFNVEDERVRDHDHLTGIYRGPSHVICNVNFKLPKFIPIFFHNMSGFDSHLMIKQLAKEEERLDVIAQNKERYISFTKHILVDSFKNKEGKEQNVFLKLRFLDSFRFMPSGLDKLSENLKSEQCREVGKFFPIKEQFELIRQKGVFPYSYVDSFSKLDDKKLPTHKDFYNSLKNEDISMDDYKRACTAWDLFECGTLGDYSDIYLKSDVLLLADVFENFRDVCIDVYGLDPAQYFTAPGLTWDSMLKHTSIELELLTDLDMIHFLKHGIRGGVSQCSVRKAFANNKFMPNYDASKPSSYIMYLDATNLYGAAMSQFLPTGNFKWLEEDAIQNLDYLQIADESDTGYIFEVNLDYPKDIHYLHNELPFCPESIASPESKSDKNLKLIPNLCSKEKYIIHFQNLKQALKHGLKLTKIHRVLTFHQSPWLKKYIDLNTIKRNQAQNKFEKDFFKLMINAMFGKTMENVDKRVDIKLITHWENIGKRLGAEAWIAKPHYKDCAIFSEHLVAIQMQKQKVVYNKPIYIGFSILDISKTIIYDFLYDYIKPKYGDSAVLLYTDTDSLILQIYTDNFYKDMCENLDKFDTSNYPENNQHKIPINQSIIGKMKDEYKGRIIWEFFGTGAKAYCVNVEGDVAKKAKGVPDYVTKKELSLDDYRLAVDVEGVRIHRKMNTFRSHLHDMYVELKNKVALSNADDKRFLIPDGSGYTLAWGHRDLELFKEQ